MEEPAGGARVSQLEVLAALAHFALISAVIKCRKLAPGGGGNAMERQSRGWWSMALGAALLVPAMAPRPAAAGPFDYVKAADAQTNQQHEQERRQAEDRDRQQREQQERQRSEQQERARQEQA